MSKQALMEFMSKAASNGDLLNEIRQTTGAGDLVALAGKHGFDASDLAPDEIQRLIAGLLGLQGAQELTSDELDMVSGAGIASLKDAAGSLGQGGGKTLLLSDRDKAALLADPDGPGTPKTAYLLEVSWVSKS